MNNTKSPSPNTALTASSQNPNPNSYSSYDNNTFLGRGRGGRGRGRGSGRGGGRSQNSYKGPWNSHGYGHSNYHSHFNHYWTNPNAGNRPYWAHQQPAHHQAHAAWTGPPPHPPSEGLLGPTPTLYPPAMHQSAPHHGPPAPTGPPQPPAHFQQTHHAPQQAQSAPNHALLGSLQNLSLDAPSYNWYFDSDASAQMTDRYITYPF